MSDSESTPSSSPPPSSCSSPTPPQTPPNLHQNSADPAALWLVQKYGGTSVGKFAVKIAEEIVPSYLDQHKLAIVCSARSGSTKALGTTNLLLRAAAEALQRNTPPATPGSNTPLTQTSPKPLARHGRAESFMVARDGTTGTGDGSPPRGLPPSSLSLAGKDQQKGLEDSRPASPSPLTISQTPLARTRSSSSPRSGSPSPFSSLSMSSMTRLAGPSSFSNTPNGNNIAPFNGTVDLLRQEHMTAARSAVRDTELLKELEGEIDRDCEKLRSFLFASQIIEEISPRSKDNIVGVGERLACKIVAAALRDQGIDAEYVSLENVVPDMEDADADVLRSGGGTLDQAFYDRVAKAVGERIKQCGTRVPVITGFFGPVPGSLLQQVGRGYTDLLAALAAVGLQASELQIWKEVDGIFTADPRKVPTARLIPIISPDEAAELTYYGSEVVHPFTMEQVIRRKIPIRIKNVMNPRGGGTVIHPNPDMDGASSLLAEGDATAAASSAYVNPLDLFNDLADPSGMESAYPQRKVPTAVTIKERIIVLNVNSNRKSVSHGFFAGIFGTLDRFGVVVDLISTSEVHVSMAIEDGLGKRTLDKLLKELEKSGSVSLHHDMAILSLVGKQMRNMVGIAGRMFTTLAEGNVNIEMISQGASEINISCVIEGRDAVKALNLIHQSCLQIRPEGALGRVGPWLF